MKTTFTKEYITDNKGCYSYEQVNNLSFINKESISLLEIIESEMPLKDKYWWFFKKCDLPLTDKQQLSIQLAEIVLEIYEAKYPNDKRPREAIQAAKDYLAGTISLNNLREKRYAAAYAAADAAAYAAAYAYAAYADAYAYAAYADAYAYAAADAAAYAAAKTNRQDLQDKLYDLLKKFIIDKLESLSHE